MEGLAWRFLLSSEREAEEAWQRILGNDAPYAYRGGRRRRRGPDPDRWVFGGDAGRELAPSPPSPALLPRLRRLLPALRPR